MTGPMLTVPQVSRITQLDRKTVIQHIYSGELPAVNVGGAGRGARYRIDRRDLDRWLESRKVPAA
jgi:excisionase family DNA binding protein